MPENDLDIEFEARRKEAEEHGGQVVGRLPDGTNLYAPHYEALYREILARGIPPGDVSTEEIPEIGVDYIY